MPKAAMFDMSGKNVGEVELSEAIFGIEPNESVLHDSVKNYLANQRQGTQSALTKGEVAYSTIKPWRQKGTGRARQGSTRAPQWTHGGIVFAPKPREYRVELPKKVRQNAIKCALSDKVLGNNLIVIDSITAQEYKTKTMTAMLAALKVDTRALIVLPEVNAFTIKSCANIQRVETTLVGTLNVYEIMKADKMVITAAAVKKLEEVYNK